MDHSSTQGRRNFAGLRRDLELLEALATDDAVSAMGLTVTRLADRTSRDKGQVSRALSTLSDAGFVTRDRSTLLYSLGPRIYDLAARTGEARLVREARPYLRKLVLATHETAELCVLRGNAVRTLAVEESSYAFRGLGWDGTGISAWRTHTGRTLMSDWRDDDLERWFTLHAPTDLVEQPGNPVPVGSLPLPAPGPGRSSVTDVSSFVAAVHRTRKQGFAVDDEEVEVGVVGVSAPVSDFHDHVIAALALSAPKSRLGAHLPEVGAYVAQVAKELSELMGQSPSD